MEHVSQNLGWQRREVEPVLIQEGLVETIHVINLLLGHFRRSAHIGRVVQRVEGRQLRGQQDLRILQIGL